MPGPISSASAFVDLPKIRDKTSASRSYAMEIVCLCTFGFLVRVLTRSLREAFIKKYLLGLANSSSVKAGNDKPLSVQMPDDNQHVLSTHWGPRIEPVIVVGRLRWNVINRIRRRKRLFYVIELI